MSKHAGKSAPLSRLLIVSFFSAGAAFAAAPYILKQAEGRIKVQDLSPDLMSALGYAGAFVCAFLALSFLSRHIRITVKAQGLEKTQGFAPKFARLVLAAVIFSAPLCVLLQARIPQDKTSLKSIVAEAELKAQAEKQPGYRREDRAGLGALIHKEDAHD